MTLPKARRLSREIWQPYLDQVLAGTTPELAASARSLLYALHDRHVGITPKLALGLAPLAFQPGGGRVAQGPWALVRDRLMAELGTQGKGRARFGLMLGASSGYTVFRLALPLVAKACMSEGENVLFCDETGASQLNLDQYLDYEQRLQDRILALAEGNHPEAGPFWCDRALALSGLSRGDRLGSDSWPGLAESEPAALDLIWNLDPEQPSRRPSRQTLPWATQAAPKWESRRREGGIEGIVFSRRLEDAGAALLSERVHHPLIQADRLLNSGFLVHRRQPKQQEPRAIQLIAMIPPVLYQHPQAAFLKACWCDFASRLSHQLLRQGLSHSSFQWVEGDRLDRARRLVFHLQTMSALAGYLGRDADLHFRREWIKALNVLPALLDTTGFEVLAQSAAEEPEELTASSSLTWIRHALGQWFRGGLADRRQVRHILVFLPADERAEHEESLNPFTHSGPSSRVMVTWVPQPPQSEDWHFSGLGSTGWRPTGWRPTGSGSTSRSLPSAGQDQGDAKLAGRLIEHWLSDLYRGGWR